MPGRKAFVTQAEIARLAKGMRDAGCEEFSINVEKPDGTKISIVAGKGSEAAATDDRQRLWRCCRLSCDRDATTLRAVSSQRT